MSMDETPTLTEAETAAAQMFGLSPEEYANYKSLHPKLPESEDDERDDPR
jgi:hypothetical protein